MNIIEIDNLRFGWPKQAELLINIEKFTLAAAQTLFLYGASGSGKSTFLSLLTGINTPFPGAALKILGTDLTQLNGPSRDQFRANNIGYIFQQFNLIPYLSVLDNVLLACNFSPLRRANVGSDPYAKAAQLLEKLQLSSEFFATPVTELSVGQQQRVAAARALIGEPALIIADEPSSALDQDNCRIFIDLLLSQCCKSNSALLFVSHDRSLQPLFDAHLNLSDFNHAAGSKL